MTKASANRSIRQLLNVARTYARRKRFLTLGGGYVFLAFVWGLWADPAAHLIFSACVANVLCAFIGLHLRRQFGSPQAKMTPGFAAPHLIVAALLALVVMVAVPAGEAVVRGVPLARAIAIHAQAGFLLALVCIWPKAILLTAAAPFFCGLAGKWLLSDPEEGYVALRRWLTSDDPLLAVGLLGLAAIGYCLAAVTLPRLSDQASAVDDDVAVNVGNASPLSGRWNQWTLAACDQRVEHRLMDAGHGWWNVQRWRLPLAFSWRQMVVVFAVVSGLALLAWACSNNSPLAREHALIVVMLLSPIFLIMPYQPWTARRGMLDLELLRPVSRGDYVRQLSLALATDVVLWSGAISIYGVSAIATLASMDLSIRLLALVGVFLLLTWSLTIFLYGVAVFTFRWRLWIPAVTLGTVVWLAVPSLIGAAFLQFVNRFGPVATYTAIVANSLLMSSLLCIWTYRRWLSTDIGIRRG